MTPEERKAFKERMKQLKAYREQNPGKGYWDFKDERTDHPVERPMIFDPIPRVFQPRVFQMQQAQFVPDTRSAWQRQQEQQQAAKDRAQAEQAALEQLGAERLSSFLTFSMPSTWIGPAFRDNNKSYFENVTSGEGFGDPVANLAFDVMLPFGIKGGRNFISRVGNSVDKYTFVKHGNSFTRGIGGKAGLDDLFESGVVRGNPVGTETTAKAFGKLRKSNRGGFNDIMKSTGVEDSAIHWYQRTLSKEEFDAIKEASTKFEDRQLPGRLLRQRGPLDNYANYDDYLKTIAEDRKTLRNATSLDDSGQPLAYFYDDGRNPLTAGHSYAKSEYGVRINNASDYNPRIFDGHLHYSMPNAVSLTDPNVELFGRGPFGLTLKLDKQTGNPLITEKLRQLVLGSNPLNSAGTYNSRITPYAGGGETGDDEPVRTGTTQYDPYGNVTYYLPTSIENGTANIGLPEVSVTPYSNLNLVESIDAGRRGAANIGKEIFSTLTPYGDLESAVQAYDAAKNRDWLGLSLAGLGMLPIVPNVSRYVKHGKLKPHAVPTVNKNANQELINAQLRLLQDTAEKRVKASNEQYRVVERMMDDPAYLRRAEEVQAQFGDNYPTAYADAFISYNVDPTSLPQVSMMDDYSSFGNMERLSDGSFLYHKSRLIDQPFNAEHEVGHYIDMLKAHSGNVDVDNKMFKEMDKDLKHEVDRYDRYYMQPTEQKSHMNQLREWMFQNGMLETRDQKVNVNDLKKALKAVKDIPGMEGVVRASEQFGDMKLYRKWFNTIPLISTTPFMLKGLSVDKNSK